MKHGVSVCVFAYFILGRKTRKTSDNEFSDELITCI